MPVADAFVHIQQVVGGHELAEEELRQRLVSGDLEAQDRYAIRGEGIEIIPLAPKDFKPPHGLLFYPIPGLTSWPYSDYRELPRAVLMQQLLGHNIFVRGAGVYRIWPIGGNAEKPQQVALPTKRPHELGRKAWLAASKVWELWREGYRWPDREQLLRKVRDRIGTDGLSMRTLDKALAYLRQERPIDR
jgi:hypothetical protein